MNLYKKNNSFEIRFLQSKKVLDKYYPEKIPVIIQKHKREKNFPQIDKEKFLIPKGLDYAQLLYVIRNRLKLINDPGIALFLSTENGNMLTTNDIISDIYEINKDKEDNFLYLFYCGENTFG